MIVKIAPPSLLISENYGNEDLLKLPNKFSDFVVSWQSFLHHVQREQLSQSKDTIELLQYIVKDQFLTVVSQKTQKLAKIALTITLSTTWAERGFSIMVEIKTKKRNRRDEICIIFTYKYFSALQEFIKKDAEKIALR